MAISQRHLGLVAKFALNHSSSARCFAAGLLACLAAVIPAFAQSNTTTTPAGPAPDVSSTDGSAPPRHCWFTVFEAAGQAPDDVCFEDPGHKAQTLVFDPRSRSITYEYKGPNKLVFFKQTPPLAGLPAGTRSARESYASIDIPSKGDHFLFVFLPPAFAQQNNQPVIYALDDSTAVFPFGSVRLLNVTKNNLAGEVGNTRLPLQPGASQSLPDSSNGSLNVALAIYYEGKARLSYASNVRTKRGARTLLILMPSLRPGSIQVNLVSLDELPTKSPATPKAAPTDAIAQTN